MNRFKGRKTYALGLSLITYLIVSVATGQEPDQNIVNGMLAAMGLTIRMGVARSSS